MKKIYKEVDVLIPQCESRAGLAIVRALAKAGVSCVVTSKNRDNIVYWSRYAKHFSAIAYDESSPQDFFDQHMALAKQYKVKMILPITDQGITTFNNYRDKLPASIKLALPNQKAINTILNKNASFDMAGRLSVPYPVTYPVETVENIPNMVKALGFPLVLKNIDPDNPDSRLNFPFRYLIAHDQKELDEFLQRYCWEGHYPLFQQYVEGRAHNVCCLASKGETLAMHEYVSLRRGSHVGIYREIKALDSRLEQYCRDILADLKWDGVAQIGFLVDHLTGDIWFMEVNGRFWASVQGSKNAGWNFPLWHYDLFRGGVRPDIPALIEGSKTRWHRGDLEALLKYLNGDPSPELYTDPGKLRSIVRYLKGFSPSIGTDVFSITDPGPAIIDHWHLVRSMMRAVSKRLKD